MACQTLAWDWTSEPGRRGSPLVEQQSGEGGRQPTCLHRLCAKCYQHRMLLLILPPDWVSLSPALPCPSPAPTLPPVYVMQQERKKDDDIGCQAALAACWAALCCCCLLDNLD